MTADEAIDFLETHQPLPPTRQVEDAVIQRFDEVRRFFAVHLDDRCVPLLLGAFGDGDGHGVYQLVEDTILHYPEDKVVAALKTGLQSDKRSVREWNAEVAARYNSMELVEPLVVLLRQGGADEQVAAAIALSRIQVPEVHQELEFVFANTVDDEVKSIIGQILDNRQHI